MLLVGRLMIIALGIAMVVGGILMVTFRVQVAKWFRDGDDPKQLFMPLPFGTERFTPTLMMTIGVGLAGFGAVFVWAQVSQWLGTD